MRTTPAQLHGGGLRWLSPLPLWAGILAGPAAWALDLSVSYALAKWTCATQRTAVLHVISPAALVVVAGGAWLSYRGLRQTRHISTHDGDRHERVRFMALLGLTSCALFALTIMAGAVPRWVLDACR